MFSSYTIEDIVVNTLPVNIKKEVKNTEVFIEKIEQNTHSNVHQMLAKFHFIK